MSGNNNTAFATFKIRDDLRLVEFVIQIDACFFRFINILGWTYLGRNYHQQTQSQNSTYLILIYLMHAHVETNCTSKVKTEKNIYTIRIVAYMQRMQIVGGSPVFRFQIPDKKISELIVTFPQIMDVIMYTYITFFFL